MQNLSSIGVIQNGNGLTSLWSIGDSQHGSNNSIALQNMWSLFDSQKGTGNKIGLNNLMMTPGHNMINKNSIGSTQQGVHNKIKGQGMSDKQVGKHNTIGLNNLWSIGDSQHGSNNSIALQNMLRSIISDGSRPITVVDYKKHDNPTIINGSGDDAAPINVTLAGLIV